MAAVSVFVVSSPLKVILVVFQTAAGLGFSQDPSPRNHMFRILHLEVLVLFSHIHCYQHACCAHEEVIWSWFPKTLLLSVGLP